MATHTSSVRDYAALLAKSKLLPADEAESLYRLWKAESRGADDQVDSFRKFLLGRRCLTEYQAAMLLRGRADGFFIGGYKILDRIGKGQMGGVYRAVHTLGQIVALKILPASKGKDTHILGRFLRESRLLPRLDHPNVVRAYQVGEVGSVHYIVLEYLDGETLDQVLARRKKLPVGEAVRVIHQALLGAQHLLDRGIVHRDLKPANIMLYPPPAAGKADTTWDATVKLFDLSLGRELVPTPGPNRNEVQLTVEGSMLGTPDYLAPEQARHPHTSDNRADIYSLGCVLYQCLTGYPPFPDRNVMTQTLKHATEKPAPLGPLVPDLPAGFQQVLDVMMAKDPNQRFATPAKAAEGLKPFLTTKGEAKPANVAVVPAYQAWLETESRTGLPKTAEPPAQSRTPVTPPATAIPVPPARSIPPAPSKASKPPTPAPIWQPTPVTSPALPRANSLPLTDEFEVELVPEPVLVDDRAVWELNRRDLVMLALGGAGVLAAVGFGYGLARALRRKPTEPPPDPGQP